MPSQRHIAIQTIDSRQVRRFELPKDDRGNTRKVSDYYGEYTFNPLQMKDKLPKETYQKLLNTVHTGKRLDTDVANTIAHVIKEWALEKGVTHFCHWFQPQTGTTAEKHDAFIAVDENNRAIEKFSAS